MTTTVMGQEDDGVNRAMGPIVLAFNCPEIQRYLSKDNVPLQRLINPPLVRVELTSQDIGILPYLCEQWDADAKVGLAERHSELSWTELKEKLSDDEWLVEQCIQALRTCIREKLPLEESCVPGTDHFQRIFIVFLNKKLVARPRFRVVLEQAFPNAWFFQGLNSASLPERIWLTLACHECGDEMRDAGSSFVCEHRGSTRGMLK